VAFGGTGSARSIAYGYDAAARLRSVTDSAIPGTSPFLYEYKAGTAQVSRIATPSGSEMVNTRDGMGRVTLTAFKGAGGNTLNSFAYDYNAAGQRATETGPRGNVTFGYNGRSELNSATGLGAPGSTGNYNYQYDDIGNRESATVLSTLNAQLSTTTYQPNELNQYNAITVDGEAPSAPIYDLNGNMTADGSGATFAFDEENRIVSIQSAIGNRKSEFLYDGMSRRVETKEFENATLVKTVRYVYDGLLPVEELEWSGVATGAPVAVRQITRGTDLSGSLEGAGGVGGLLAYIAGSSSAWYFADGNGNVAGLYGTSDTSEATYTYDPFGRRLNATGPLASINTYQWSSKEHHEPSGLVYYLHRYYNPETGRWVSRDPIEERGGVNLFGMVGNDPINFIDLFGLYGTATAISEIESSLKSSTIARELGFFDALHKLPTSGYSITTHPSGVVGGAAASYRPNLNQMNVNGPTPDSLTVVHEMVHAYNDLNGLSLSARDDEGMAYAFEGIYQGLRLIQSLENQANNPRVIDCKKLETGARGIWQNFWKSYGSPSKYSGQVSDGYFFKTMVTFSLTDNDFYNVKRHLGARISCETMAKILNDMPKIKGCCIKFTCSKGMTSMTLGADPAGIDFFSNEIPAGVEISEVFK